MPTMWHAGVYSSVMHYLKAVAATSTDEPLKVAAQMRATPVEDFFARQGGLREDGLMVHDLYLVEVKKPEESSPAGDPRRGRVSPARGRAVPALEEVTARDGARRPTRRRTRDAQRPGIRITSGAKM
jgi:hypothetical protein